MAVFRAEDAQFIAEQWGNRKNRNAIDCLTMKMLTCESTRIMRRRAALMAMDAAACYDRIITYLSNISERRYGLPSTACKAKGEAVFNMRRHVRTAFGDSAVSWAQPGFPATKRKRVRPQHFAFPEISRENRGCLVLHSGNSRVSLSLRAGLGQNLRQN